MKSNPNPGVDYHAITMGDLHLGFGSAKRGDFNKLVVDEHFPAKKNTLQWRKAMVRHMPLHLLEALG